MIALSTLKGRTVAVFGLGGSGLATCAALAAGGARVIAFDDNPASVAKAAEAGHETADLRHADWSDLALLVLTPGVPLTHPAPHWTVGLAHASGVEVVGDIELFGQVGDHLGRDIERIRQEHAKVTHSHELEGETEAVAVAATLGDQLAIGIVEVKEPLQIRLRQHTEPAVFHGPLITHSRT